MTRSEKYDLTGKRFGKLEVKKRVPPMGREGTVYWEVLCDCGNTTIVEGPNLRRGNTKSCGCLRRNFAATRKRDKKNQKWI